MQFPLAFCSLSCNC